MMYSHPVLRVRYDQVGRPIRAVIFLPLSPAFHFPRSPKLRGLLFSSVEAGK